MTYFQKFTADAQIDHVEVTSARARPGGGSGCSGQKRHEALREKDQKVNSEGDWWSHGIRISCPKKRNNNVKNTQSWVLFPVDEPKNDMTHTKPWFRVLVDELKHVTALTKPGAFVLVDSEKENGEVMIGLPQSELGRAEDRGSATRFRKTESIHWNELTLLLEFSIIASLSRPFFPVRTDVEFDS